MRPDANPDWWKFRKERELFERDGYAIFRSVLDANLIAEVSAHYEWVKSRRPEEGKIRVRDVFTVRLIADSISVGLVTKNHRSDD